MNVVHFLFTLVRLRKFQHIRHYFPVRGHSFLPNDRDFAVTELKKRKTERVNTPEQWHRIIESARKRKPFVVVPVEQDMIMDGAAHFCPFFKKTIKAGKKLLNLQRAMILDYSVQHSTEIWVKYGNEDEEWSKFTTEKRHAAVKSLPTKLKYVRPLPVKQSKARDVRKLAVKYAPPEYRHFFESVKGDEDVSSETEESDF